MFMFISLFIMAVPFASLGLALLLLAYLPINFFIKVLLFPAIFFGFWRLLKLMKAKYKERMRTSKTLKKQDLRQASLVTKQAEAVYKAEKALSNLEVKKSYKDAGIKTNAEVACELTGKTLDAATNIAAALDPNQIGAIAKTLKDSEVFSKKGGN